MEILKIENYGGNYHVTVNENGEVFEDVVTPSDLKEVALTWQDTELGLDTDEHVMDRVEENVEYYINAYYAEWSVA